MAKNMCYVDEPSEIIQELESSAGLYLDNCILQLSDLLKLLKVSNWKLMT